jgi:hypothetical protein
VVIFFITWLGQVLCEGLQEIENIIPINRKFNKIEADVLSGSGINLIKNPGIFRDFLLSQIWSIIDR